MRCVYKYKLAQITRDRTKTWPDKIIANGHHPQRDYASGHNFGIEKCLDLDLLLDLKALEKYFSDLHHRSDMHGHDFAAQAHDFASKFLNFAMLSSDDGQRENR